MASPCTTATTGSGQSSMARSMTSMPLALPAPADLLRSAMSSPAQNTSPLPRITSTRSSGATGACSTSIMLPKSSLSSAFLFSGRFIQTVFTGPLFSTMTLLMVRSLRFDACGLDVLRPPHGLALHVGGEIVETERRDFHAALGHRLACCGILQGLGDG